MVKINSLYLLTIVLWIMYIIWEILFRYWAASQPLEVIRYDLMVIVPVLLMLSMMCYLKYKGKF